MSLAKRLWSGGNMRPRKLAFGIILALLVTVMGCTHRVVANPGEHTVKLYPDEATYQKVANLKSQGGPMGMIGGLGEGMVAKTIDNNTPVRIISQDSLGAEIEVTDGPHKGMTGFVAKENVS